MPVCTYCLDDFPELTKDHVFARSWYPDSTPDNTYKPQVPACSPCNNKYSHYEEELLLLLAMCADPSHPASLGIVAKALRSVDPSQARGPRDAFGRRGKRQRLLKRIQPMDRLPTSGLLPSFRENWLSGSRTAILVPAEELKTVVKKWIRGIHYLTTGRRIGRQEVIDVFFAEDEHAEAAFKLLRPHTKQYIHGPGIVIEQAVAAERGEEISLYDITIWEQFRALASVEYC